MFDVHLTTIKVIDIENNKVVIDSTFGEKEYVLDKIKNGVRFELQKCLTISRKKRYMLCIHKQPR